MKHEDEVENVQKGNGTVRDQQSLRVLGRVL